MTFLTKMGDFLYCPLCCNAKFNSKQSLVEHLSKTSADLICPICENKFSSIGHLTEHLNHDDCDVRQEMLFEEANTVINRDNKSVLSLGMDRSNDEAVTDDMYENHQPNSINLSTADESSDMSKMYVELLSKQLMKPCLQTQEPKLVKEGSESRYLILTNEDSLINSGSAVLTEQNMDGNILLTTIKDSKYVLEKETPILEQEQEYSCNTCGVSFTSVEDHIKNYHNDQDVVVEEAVVEGESSSFPIQSVVCEDAIVDKQISRRMITDTGDIVEEPFVKEEPSDVVLTKNQVEVPTKRDHIEKPRVYTRRFVQVDKFCNSMIKDIRQTDEKEGAYHKVIMKEMQSESGERMKVYNCMSCNVYVTSLSEFKNHPCRMLKYPCPLCSVVYDNSKSLCAHMKVHKPKPDSDFILPIKFECEICSTVFPASKSLKLHKRMHDPIKSRPIEPPVETSDGSAVSCKKFLCSTCDKLIPIDYRVIHQNSHKASNKMICDICNKKFHSKEYLEMHMTVHNINKVTIGKQDKSLPYDCLYCERKFARPHEKVKHERIHTGEKPHSCEICGKAFRVSYCLTLHMRTHTGARPYACPHCNKRFKAHSVYNHHLLTHSDVRAYKCPFCPKAFKTSVQLAGHKNSHTKPFSCQQCNRPFASLYAVREHMAVHARHNSLKFSCSQCGASYARAFALKDHVRQAHEQEDLPLQTVLKDDGDWKIDKIGDSSYEITVHKNALPNEINDLELGTSELVVP